MRHFPHSLQCLLLLETSTYLASCMRCTVQNSKHAHVLLYVHVWKPTSSSALSRLFFGGGSWRIGAGFKTSCLDSSPLHSSISKFWREHWLGRSCHRQCPTCISHRYSCIVCQLFSRYTKRSPPLRWSIQLWGWGHQPYGQHWLVHPWRGGSGVLSLQWAATGGLHHSQVGLVQHLSHTHTQHLSGLATYVHSVTTAMCACICGMNSFLPFQHFPHMYFDSKFSSLPSLSSHPPLSTCCPRTSSSFLSLFISLLALPIHPLHLLSSPPFPPPPSSPLLSSSPSLPSPSYPLQSPRLTRKPSGCAAGVLRQNRLGQSKGQALAKLHSEDYNEEETAWCDHLQAGKCSWGGGGCHWHSKVQDTTDIQSCLCN